MTGHLQDSEKTSDVFLDDVVKSRKAYREAEEEFQRQLQLLLDGASYVALRTRMRARAEKERV